MTEIPARDLVPGDEVLVHPRVGWQVVASVVEYADGTVVVSYFHRGERVYENKARNRSGEHVVDRLVEIGLASRPADSPLEARRGSPAVAAELRARMESERIEREAIAEDRAARAARRRAA